MRALTWDQWTEIVAKLNASFPRQPIEPLTAREWFSELADRRAELVWRALRRLRCEQSFMPSLAELLGAYHAEVRAERDRVPALPASDPDGVPPPADFQAARARLLVRTKLPGNSHRAELPPKPDGAPPPYGQWGQERVDALKKPEHAG